MRISMMARARWKRSAGAVGRGPVAGRASGSCASGSSRAVRTGAGAIVPRTWSRYGRADLMKSSEEVLNLLNQLLTNELTAINQYFLHAKMCENWGYKRLSTKLRDESIDEMKHA